MRFMMHVRIPNDAGNAAIKDPEFGTRMGQVLEEIGAEAAYFTAVDGQRGGYIIVNLNDVSEIPSKAEPFFLWLEADVDFLPVMMPQDLAKADAGIRAAVKKWA